MSRVASKAFHSVAKEAGLRRESRTMLPKVADPAHQEMARLHEYAGNNAVNALLGGGVPLDPGVRAEMEARFGESFTNVRVHDDDAAHRSAAGLEARAYTVGNDVAFSERRYAPNETEGKRLLAHELAHVVQQRRGGPTPELAPDAAHERAADVAAAAIVTGSTPVSVQRGTAVGIARDYDDDEDERVDKRQEDKERTQRRKEERARAGQDESQIAQRRAKAELRKLEKDAKAPGAKRRSTARKETALKRYEDVLQDAPGTTLEKNKRKGAFDESQRTGGRTAGKPQEKWVAGGPQLPHQELRPGKDKYAQPDYSIYRHTKDGRLERLHVNLKSDKLHLQSEARAAATARYNTAQAIRNSASLPTGESIVISYARVPLPEVQHAMLKEHFKSGSPISEVRFGTTTYKRAQYQPPPTEKPQAAAPKADVKTTAQQPKTQATAEAKAENQREEELRKEREKAAKPPPKPKNRKPVPPQVRRRSGVIPGPPIEPGGNLAQKQEVAPPVPEEVPPKRAAPEPKPQQEPASKNQPPSRVPPSPKPLTDPRSGRQVQRIGELIERRQRALGSIQKLSAAKEAGAAAIGQALGDLSERLNELGIRLRVEEEQEKLVPRIKEYQQKHPTEGVLLVVQVETWNPNWKPSDTRPTKRFVSVIPEMGGRSKEEAIDRWSESPRLLQGAPKGSTISTEFIWIPPGTHLSLSRSPLINGRYRSRSDNSRMLVLRFEDDGSFHFDAVDPRSGTHIGVRVVRPWKLDIKDGSLAMSAVFHDPATQLDVESELAVIDSESIHETWKTTTGLTGDNLWQKVDN